MSSSLWRKVALLSVVASCLGVLAVNGPLSIGQEKKAAEKKTEKAKGRLPAYYADVVTEDQKTKIYAVQEKYAKQLKDLNDQLAALTKKQNDEIEAVLTAEQKSKIETARADAAAKKKKKASDKKVSTTTGETGSATTKTK